jgi:hypothetical protein
MARWQLGKSLISIDRLTWLKAIDEMVIRLKGDYVWRLV